MHENNSQKCLNLSQLAITLYIDKMFLLQFFYFEQAIFHY